MARARLRPCSVPGCPALQPETRCAKHRTEDNRHRRRTTPTKVAEPSDRARRAAAVRAHRARHGNWCPGWGRDGHRSTDLTADHITPVAAGGSPSGALQVLCRGCNGRKGSALTCGNANESDEGAAL